MRNVKVAVKDREQEPMLPAPVLIDEWETYAGVPARAGCRLRGKVYGHSRFSNGETIITSRVVWLAGDRAQTQNTLYQLGARKSAGK